MSTSGTMKTLAFRRSAPRKVGQDARAFREEAASVTRRQDAAHEHQRTRANLGFACVPPPGKSGRMPELSVKLPRRLVIGHTLGNRGDAELGQDLVEHPAFKQRVTAKGYPAGGAGWRSNRSRLITDTLTKHR